MRASRARVAPPDAPHHAAGAPLHPPARVHPLGVHNDLAGAARRGVSLWCFAAARGVSPAPIRKNEQGEAAHGTWPHRPLARASTIRRRASAGSSAADNDAANAAWEALRRHHAGEWHGEWSEIGADGQTTRSWLALTSVRFTDDGSSCSISRQVRRRS